MNKTAIKNYAIWARVQLIESAKQRAYEYEITENGENRIDIDTIGGRLLTETEKQQRIQLISQIQQKGYVQVMEEAAYTWFNRFIALRFMEVNGYLPSKVRVFTDESGAFKPEILKEAMSIDLPGVDRQLVLELLDKQDNEALYKHLLIAQCNALNAPLPYMFEKISNWTELLFPANLLRQDSVIGTMISSIPEEDWTDAVQIIGWLYQYYNSELKDETFALLKKNVKITKERIPAATQLFTPDWIVRYMVENSLGRLWYEGHKDFDKSGWKYYLDEAEQEPEVEQQLAVIRADYAKIKPEEIKIIDPCMGSGHILVYAFDVLMQIYTAAGWSERDAVKSILLNNLYGLDIDDRAGQLAYFAVMMKAQQYDNRWLSRQSRNPIQLNVFALQNSGDWPAFERQMRRTFKNHPSLYEDAAVRTAEALFIAFANAKEFGSIIQPKVTLEDLDLLSNVLDDMMRQVDLMDLAAQADAMRLMETLLPLIREARVLVQKYHVAVTNPPYMSSSGMDIRLTQYVKNIYPDSKSDLYAVFIERCRDMLKSNGLQGMITMHTWMFLGSYESFRRSIKKSDMLSLIHLGIKAFEEIGNDIVQTSAFLLQNCTNINRVATFIRLVDYKDYEQKQVEFFNSVNQYQKNVSLFEKIPGLTYAYWVSDAFIENFSRGHYVDQFGEFTGSQNVTGDNERFLRYFWEVDRSSIRSDYWVLYAKGGDYRKYYGNLQMIIDWRTSARLFYETNKTSNLLSQHLWFKEGITYSAVTSRGTGFRFLPSGCVFDKGGPSITLNQHIWEVLALLNSKVAETYFKVFNPSINLQVKDIKGFPLIFPTDDSLTLLAQENTKIAKDDWDTSETSIDFTGSPLVNLGFSSLQDSISRYIEIKKVWFDKAQNNENKINEIVKQLYKLPEIDAHLETRDIPVTSVELRLAIVELISFSVGCMFGRYSLNNPGLQFAGGDWEKWLEQQEGKAFLPDKDGILPISDDEYFDDDIVAMFLDWIKAAFGESQMEENLRYIASSLYPGSNGSPRELIRQYFLNDFFTDHLKIYQKRPIYWLFSSGKKNSFKCLIYMHRYQPDMLARIRTDYVHEQQERYRTQLQILEDALQTAGASERVKLNKQIAKLKDQALELQKYEEKIHHLADQMITIDLDDGVKVNYAKFQDVLEKIK